MSNAPIEASRHLLRLVAELHVRGYQRLRIAPGLSPSGGHWRCAIAPATQMLAGHGARLAPKADPAVHHSSANGRAYFGWDDAAHLGVFELARCFLARFPELAAAGYGADWAYAGWYQHMLHLTHPLALPIAYADWYDGPPTDHLPTIGGPPNGVRVPMPPLPPT